MGSDEGRIDARHEYDASIRRDAIDSTDLDGHVAGAIEAGGFDAEVLERAIEIVRELGVGDGAVVSALKQIHATHSNSPQKQLPKSQ